MEAQGKNSSGPVPAVNMTVGREALPKLGIEPCIRLRGGERVDYEVLKLDVEASSGYSRKMILRFRIKRHKGVCKKASKEYAWSNRPSNNRVGITSHLNVYNYGIKFQRS